MKEQLDTYSEQMEWHGVADRETVHRLGLWHQTFQCWVLHRTPTGYYAILQWRHQSKDTNPLKFDVSCAGHLEAGEVPRDGCRELKEELGIIAPPKTLQSIGTFRREAVVGDLIDRELLNVFYIIRDGETLDTVQPAEGELRGVYEIPLMELWRLGTSSDVACWVKGFQLDEHGNRQWHRQCIRSEDVVAYPFDYYAMVFQAFRTVMELQT